MHELKNFGYIKACMYVRYVKWKRHMVILELISGDGWHGAFFNVSLYWERNFDLTSMEGESSACNVALCNEKNLIITKTNHCRVNASSNEPSWYVGKLQGGEFGLWV